MYSKRWFAYCSNIRGVRESNFFNQLFNPRTTIEHFYITTCHPKSNSKSSLFTIYACFLEIRRIWLWMINKVCINFFNISLKNYRKSMLVTIKLWSITTILNIEKTYTINIWYKFFKRWSTIRETLKRLMYSSPL